MNTSSERHCSHDAIEIPAQYKYRILAEDQTTVDKPGGIVTVYVPENYDTPHSQVVRVVETLTDKPVITVEEFL